MPKSKIRTASERKQRESASTHRSLALVSLHTHHIENMTCVAIGPKLTMDRSSLFPLLQLDLAMIYEGLELPPN
ncbi:hypothetical protein CNMCM8980_010133 [Aspergillus fumigatiaffinis]|uniref:Uncharacterized protein n=1 Tax=Aspergillus fumigatiaffinis TaxID=340414 RepID=A0A8H4MFA8_9EURO|nr:hypothetical protein CNMCM6805_002081 [Aspergillus fumigatiaffinis]KAF4250811.1 hypothetical protein CNMCM8980_010133 [Aspergillus fumigatiaffinis]